MKTLTIPIVLVIYCICLSMSSAAGDVVLHHRDLQQIPPSHWRAVGLKTPLPDNSAPVVSESLNNPEYRLLRSLYARGIANGFEGILYDNRDRDHSLLPQRLFPRLNHLEYGLDLKLENVDYGVAGNILFPTIVLGNSSTALTAGPYARSLTRQAMTFPNMPAASARLYSNNHLYIYPEHRDYDLIDHYPANWPYHIVSQGSSGSDQPFLRAVAATLAAFPRDTLAFMGEHKLVAPTIQMILRRNLKQVSKPQDYFKGTAHRPVLQGENLRPTRMVAHAASLQPKDIQPMVRIEVLDEDFRETAGLGQSSEFLFDTSSAVARIWRGFEGTKTIVVSAESTEDATGEPLTFTWHLFQGDPEKVTIEPFGVAGQTANITIDWHAPFEISIPSQKERTIQTRQTSRVDIGVFASNGRGQSAPAIISIAFPAHQARKYTNHETLGSRLESIDYFSAAEDQYVDPKLYWSAEWIDTAVYSDDGKHTGWQRDFVSSTREAITLRNGSPSELYTQVQRGGRMVLEYTR